MGRRLSGNRLELFLRLRDTVVHNALQRGHRNRIKLLTGLFLHQFEDLADGHGLAIGAIGCQRIKHIGHGQNARPPMDFLGGVAVGISTAVVAFMVLGDHGDDLFERFDGLNDARP